MAVHGLINSHEERNKLARTSGAVAVDMETACAAREIRLLSLRVISDTPHELFPAPAHVLFDLEQQRTRMRTVAKYFLGHPNQIPSLIRFARRIARARKTLANALVKVVQKP
jgi:hypothetical protein